MKSKEEIEQLAKAHYSYEYGEDTSITDKRRDGFVDGYTQCQEDTKQILLDFIKWSNAVDEYGNKLDKIDVDNFLNKQD